MNKKFALLTYDEDVNNYSYVTFEENRDLDAEKFCSSINNNVHAYELCICDWRIGGTAEEMARQATAYLAQEFRKDCVIINPADAVLVHHAVPVLRAKTARLLSGICSDWDGESSLEPKNLYLTPNSSVSRNLPLFEINKVASLPERDVEWLILIGRDQVLKTYLPSYFKISEEGTAADAMQTYILRGHSDGSYETFGEALRYALGKGHDAKVLKTHSFSLPSRDAYLNRLEIDVLRLSSIETFSSACIRNIRLDKGSMQDFLSKEESSDYILPTRTGAPNSFVLMGGRRGNNGRRINFEPKYF